MALSQMLFDVPSAAHRELGLWVESCGRFAAKPSDWVVQDRVLGSYGLLHIERGSGWYQSGRSGRIEVPARSLVFLFPGMAHSYAPSPWWEERWLIFGGSVAEAFDREGILSREQPLVELGGDRAIPRQLAAVRAALAEGGPLAAALAGARLHELLVLAQGLRAGLRGDQRDASVCAAIEMIDASGGCGLTPEGLAEELEVGYSTLRRRFREGTGFSLKEYMLRAQLRRAKELLTYTSLSIDAIAARAGFRDPFYFARLFRSREGVPPSAYRTRGERGSAAVAIVDVRRPSETAAKPNGSAPSSSDAEG
jgi:AraC-like DNA-binding protein